MSKDPVIREIINSIYPVSGKSLEKIEDLLQYEEFGKGVTFIEKGSRNNKEYFVIDGICRSYLINPEGDDITLSFFPSKTVLSPYTIRIKNERSTLYFQAITKSKLASMNASGFEELMINDIEIRNFGNTVLRNELISKVEKEIGLASLTARGRLIRFREQYPLLENLIPHSDISSYLGITNISLSRLRKDLMR
jgi:CRP-like cAMP-binding protein